MKKKVHAQNQTSDSRVLICICALGLYFNACCRWARQIYYVNKNYKMKIIFES